MFSKILKDQKGVTLVELLAALAIAGIIGLALAQFFETNATIFRRGGRRADAQNTAQAAFLRITYYLREATIISNTYFDNNADGVFDGLEIHLDSNKMPGYDPDSDALDSDTLINRQDPDNDNDISRIPQSNFTGYDIQDDDDDDDGKSDMRMRFYLSSLSAGGTFDLMMDFSYNEEAWGSNVSILCKNIANDQIFQYLGSKDELLGQSIDLDSNGIITAGEIDGATPAMSGHGNSNGRLDTYSERQYINVIDIALSIDSNEDGSVDFETSTQLRPPLLRVAEY